MPRCRSCCARRASAGGCASSTCACGASCWRCSPTSAGDYLDGWFESDPIKAVYGFDGIVGNYASPYTPGSAYVLLHHVFGEVNGKNGAWGHAIGGMGAITQAMARAAAARGAHIRTATAVREVLVEGGRAVGVRHRGRRDIARRRGDLQSQPEAAVHAHVRARDAAGGSFASA